jgi:predicted ATPase
MQAKRIIADGQVADFRLTLDRVGDRIISSLSTFAGQDASTTIQFESEPDWHTIAVGFEILQCPEDHVGEDLVSLGRELRSAAFGGPITDVLSRHREKGLVRLWLNADRNLARLPWEACRFEKSGGFADGYLCFDPSVHVIREIAGAKTMDLGVGHAVKVLVAWSDPASESFPHLPGIDSDVRSVVQAFSTPECKRFSVTELPFATKGSLSRVLRELKPDIVHFVGHGELRPTGGVIILDSGSPNEEACLHGDELGDMLISAGVRLVVLSGCMTGDAISGVASELGKRGIPAVVAMQAPLHDLSAGLFARAFYSSLSIGDSVDFAIAQGRQAIRGTGNDWAVPVLLRAPFDSPHFEAEFEFDFRQDTPKVRHNLTYDDRPFIGRQIERSDIRDRISVKRQRLLSITGMGGMGKTRLAKQVASEVVDDFPDGVWMVECDTLSGRDQLVGAIVSTLGISTSHSTAEKDLVEALKSKRLLLYLDCFEGLVECGDLLDSILKHSSESQILITSRIILGIPREFEYRLSPMALKKTRGDISDGVSLFIEAASHSTNSFVTTGKNRALIRELCDELEGVPLAVILAAGRLRHLSLSELLEQVRENPLNVLMRRGGPKDRQADLYRVVSTSFMLLDERERDLLDILSLFVGSFEMEDATEVCGYRKADLLARMSTLRDHSLVQVQTANERTRYKLLDTVREVLAQLPRGPKAEAERHASAMRHAERYTAVGEVIGSLFLEGRTAESKAILWRDIGNLRAACEFSASQGRFDLTKRLVNGLLRIFFETALYADFEKLSDAGFVAARALSDSSLESTLYGLTGALYAVRQDEGEWLPRWLRRIEICQEAGDIEGCADALSDLASEYNQMGRVDEAEKFICQGIDLAERNTSYGLLANFYAQRAHISVQRGDSVTAAKWVDEAFTAALIDKNNQRFLGAWQYIGITNEALGRIDIARNIYLRFLKMNFEADTFRAIAWSCLKLASLFETTNEPELALLSLMTVTKLQAEVATRQGEKANTLLSQFLKRQGNDLLQTFASEKKTPWRELCRRLITTAYQPPIA